MKKFLIILSILAVSAFSTFCSRAFDRAYAQDGNGGLVRHGYKLTFLYINWSYMEHCVPEGGVLVCSSVKVKFQ